MGTKIKAILEMELETDQGEALSGRQMQAVADDAESAMRNRLMGEGFLPADIYVESYSIRFKLA